MLATIDKAGRVVVPKELREQAGLLGGQVEISLSATGVLIEVPTAEPQEHKGKLFLPRTGKPTTAEQIRELRHNIFG